MADDVLVQAEVFLGGLHSESAVELFPDAEVALPFPEYVGAARAGQLPAKGRTLSSAS